MENDLRDFIDSKKTDQSTEIKHTFILATNLRSSNRIQEKALALSLEFNIEVLVWSWEYLVNSVKNYPRLQRLYGSRGSLFGVNLIDADFIQKLEIKKPNPFRFYTSHVEGDWQWLGVYYKLAARRNCEDEIISRLDSVFGQSSCDQKIVAVLCGDGGSGKSISLRQIALILVSRQNSVCWWIVNINSFLLNESNIIQAVPYTHLTLPRNREEDARISDQHTKKKKNTI